MSFYTKIYNNICQHGKQRKSLYLCKQSDLHEHHIIPKHRGGCNSEKNLTYLTIKEHIACHFLLWKISRCVNDLRAMKMLGAKLSKQYRQKIGKWCFENNVGMYGASNSTKKVWRLRGNVTQMKQKVGIFDPKKRPEYASIGGKASIRSINNPWSYWASKEGQIHRASLGGKAHRGKICMYKPGESSFIRVKVDSIDTYKNMGYVVGSPIKTNLGKKFGPSPKRRRVTDGTIVYESLHDAAHKNSISPSTVVHRCKSKNSTWRYVCENEPSQQCEDEHNQQG